MPRGGVRANQTGRPVGVKTGQGKVSTMTPTARKQMTDALVEKVKDINITPLEVMLNDMKLHHDEARGFLAQSQEVKDDEEKRVQLLTAAKVSSGLAVESAVKVAPYIHAKLQTTTLKGDKESPLELALMSSDALKAAVRGGK